MRTIKPENWQTLASTLYDGLGHYLTDSEIAEFRVGHPSYSTILMTIRGVRRTAHLTHNAHVRATCKSIAETMLNYGLVSRDAVVDLLRLK